jgi:hypothetical protein
MFQLIVPSTNAVQLSHHLGIESRITTFLISNPSFNSAPVYLGFSQMVASSGTSIGFETVPGTYSTLTTYQEGRQSYELQTLVNSLNTQGSGSQMLVLPFVIWDMTKIWMISGGTVDQQICVMAYESPYM